MDRLCISITFLDGRFHGQKDDLKPEWPPSPWRLYQALLAAAAGNQKEDPAIFQWFEQLNSPEILAPKVQAIGRVKVFVPNNASDVNLDRQKRLAEKIHHPSVICGENHTLHYLWSIDSNEHLQASRIADYAKLLNVVGLGIDLVAGNGQLLSNAEATTLKSAFEGDCYKLGSGAGNVLRSPKKGSYQDLKAAHESQLNRFEGKFYSSSRKPTVFDEFGFVKEGAMIRHIACFKLTYPDEESARMRAFDPRYSVRLSSWIRGYLCNNHNNFNGDPESYIGGHISKSEQETPPRFSYLPLPTIGNEHADGLIRRLIVAEPYGENGSKAQWAQRNLNNVVLKNKEGVEVAELLSLQEKDDGVLRCYTKTSRIFKSVTPVILPGFDSLKYKKAEQLFLKAIRQAGFNCDDIEDFLLQKAPFFKGAYSSREYKRVKHFENFSAMHVRINWKHEMHGPLAIGAGRHRGLGLFAPVDD